MLYIIHVYNINFIKYNKCNYNHEHTSSRSFNHIFTIGYCYTCRNTTYHDTFLGSANKTLLQVLT